MAKAARKINARLNARQAGMPINDPASKYRYHKPGSQNRKK